MDRLKDVLRTNVDVLTSPKDYHGECFEIRSLMRRDRTLDSIPNHRFSFLLEFQFIVVQQTNAGVTFDSIGKMSYSVNFYPYISIHFGIPSDNLLTVFWC